MNYSSTERPGKSIEMPGRTIEEFSDLQRGLWGMEPHERMMMFFFHESIAQVRDDVEDDVPDHY